MVSVFSKMPKSARKWHPRKEPSLQIRILKHIALKGTLSQNDATKLFERSHSTISEALNIMRKKRSLIEFATPPDFKSGERHRKYYKLTADGLIAFIDQNPIPYEFWVALMWHCNLNSEDIISKNQLTLIPMMVDSIFTYSPFISLRTPYKAAISMLARRDLSFADR